VGLDGGCRNGTGTYGPFFRFLADNSISARGVTEMKRDLVLDGLRFKLAQKYQENPTRFLSLSREIMDSSSSREIVAELRNEGHVEEDVRGTIRFTARGYRAFQNDPPPYSYSD